MTACKKCLVYLQQLILRHIEDAKFDILDIMNNTENSILDKEIMAKLFAKNSEIEDLEAQQKIINGITKKWETEKDLYKVSRIYWN